jgi:hypothetical protein
VGFGTVGIKETRWRGGGMAFVYKPAAEVENTCSGFVLEWVGSRY